MILTMLRVMTLHLLRDRGALALAFLLPPTIFVIFATIFSGATGNEISVRVALAVPEPSVSTERVVNALREEPLLRVLDGLSRSAEAAGELVDEGEADAAVVLSADLKDTEGSPILVLVDPAKVLAGSILSGQIQRLVAVRLPDVAISRMSSVVGSVIGGFTPEQSTMLTAFAKRLESEGASEANSLVRVTSMGSRPSSDATVTYYAGAVAILFLLFSCMQSAATLIEERRSGIVDRIAIGPAGIDAVVIGKFLFLTFQGVMQVSLIFCVAALVYRVEVLPYLPLWFLTTVVASLAVAGLGLAVASACTTKQQAHTVATFVILVFSALGGSMVPRFLMPSWLQDVGYFTPNAWTIDAFYGVIWRGETFADIYPELSWLLLLAALSLLAAMLISKLRLQN